MKRSIISPKIRRRFMSNLTNKVALVTGGSRGIGAAIAKGLAADGASVAITYAKDTSAASAVVKAIELGGGKARRASQTSGHGRESPGANHRSRRHAARSYDSHRRFSHFGEAAHLGQRRSGRGGGGRRSGFSRWLKGDVLGHLWRF